MAEQDKKEFEAFLKENLKPGETLFSEQSNALDRSFVPEPVYEEDPDLTGLYYAAWESAWGHIFTCPGAPVQTYMNEGIRINKIWIWDTCFMVLFCRYAAKYFPGIQSLDNFYRVIHDGEYMILKVHHADNPPLFAWTEYEYFKHTGDMERLKYILCDKQYLQKHYHWLEEVKAGSKFAYSSSTVAAQWVPGRGFLWAGCPSGMDNTPRGDDDYTSIYWLDLSAQQGLSALYISRLFRIIGDEAQAEEWYKKFEEQKDFVNARFWSDDDKIYFDRKVDESGFCKVLTPASFWPMLAEMCDNEQASQMAGVFEDPGKLGGERPIPSLSRDDHRFTPSGGYWRGSMWMPTAYMSIKALEKYGFYSLADSLARKILRQQLKTWQNVEPHTIWECYSPTKDYPAENKVQCLVRQDFCGWSALGPISLFIENILGIRDVDVISNSIVWEPASAKRSGIKNLRLGNNVVSLIAYPAQGKAEVEASAAFTLRLNGSDIQCPPGKSVIPLP